MVTAVVAGAITVLVVGLVAWRGGPGRAWYAVGLLMTAIAGEADWYALNHGWQTTHHYVKFIVMPTMFAGMAIATWGMIKSAMSKARRTRARPKADH